jgi:TPR repeat protein
MSRGVLEKAAVPNRPTPPAKSTAGSLPAVPAGSIKVLWLPAVLALLLAAFPLVSSRAGDNPHLAQSLWFTSAVLLIFTLVLSWSANRAGRTLYYEVVLNKVHYVQLVMHISVYSYWGWYWREVYHYVPLLIAQLVFAYALDMLICWSRRDKWIAGFGPFPIILSTNLFLWFRDDWFYLQFLLIATGVIGKEFIKWKREGRLTHIFNPSALSLFLFSVVLIATKNTDMTWGIEIANTIHRPPHIYLEIFLLGLVVQSLFRVTLVTLFSAVALCLLNLVYTGITGDYNFIDSNIPVAVFLGLHLLVTDPATSPRKSLGKVLFGLMYGAGVFGVYRLLVLLNAPEFYDKLLCVPILNLTVCALDRFSGYAGEKFKALSRFKLPSWNPRQANFGWMGVWVTLFIVMVSTGFLSKGKDHPGGDPEYWHRACEQGRGSACATWVRTLNAMCESNASAACLTLGQVLNEGQIVPRNAALAGVSLGRACDLNSASGCSKLVEFAQSGGVDALTQSCNGGNGAGCFILGSLYSAGSGVHQDSTLAFNLFRKSCDSGWWRGCGRLGVSYLVGQGTPIDPVKAVESLEKGCQGHNAASCVQVAKVYWEGTAGSRDQPLALDRLKQACDLGMDSACQQREKLAAHP